jgi:uncharacterized protein (TIGR02594 family)
MSIFSWFKNLFKRKPTPVTATPLLETAGWPASYSKLVNEFTGEFPELPASRQVFWRALALAESGLDPRSVYFETDPSLQINSVGLLQLSLVDIKNYGFKDLDIKTEEDLKDPIKNLKLGMAILSRLHKIYPNENIYKVGGRYWSVLRREKEWPGKKQDGFQRFFRALGVTEPSAPVKPETVASPSWLEIAKKEMGQKEISGSKDNPKIIEYHSMTSLKASDDETPWCSSFVNWVMYKAGYNGTANAMARSWLRWGQSLSRPRLGCIVVFWRGSPTSSSGHVGFWLGENSGKVRVLGGNQSNMVCESTYSLDQVLGYRWPS